MSLTKGGGFDVAPSSMGHDATTLMRDMLQAHLLTYDFLHTGCARTPRCARPLLAHSARGDLCCSDSVAREGQSSRV